VRQTLPDAKHLLARTFSTEGLTRNLASDDITLLVAETTQQIVGFCSYGTPVLDDCDCEDLIEIHRLFVHPDYRRQGIGEAFIDALEDSLNEQAGVQRVSAYVDPTQWDCVQFFATMEFYHDAAMDIDDMWYMELDI